MKTQISLFLLISLCTSLSFSQSNFIGSGITLQLNGDNGNHVDLGDVYNDLNFPLSVEAWVNPSEWTEFGDYAAVIATDNLSTGSYYGFWFRFNSTGKLIFEIGDGSGAGSTDRRGKITTNSIELNTWTHIAVVATSVTDIKFYFNGIVQPATNTDGGATNTSLVHNSNPASIGRQITPFNEHNFIGQIDEVRLWNISRTEEELRTFMCKKITDLPDGLIGYWNFDQSYLSSTVSDLTIPAEDGTMSGDAEKITSGAPIGDESINLYTEDWTGVKMTIHATASDDFFRIKKIMNDPKGMHIYRIDTIPYFTDGLSDYPGYYFGVFQVNDLTPAEYGISYRFSSTNGVVTEDNADLSTLYTKENGSINSWADLEAVIDAAQPFIRKVGNNSRKEVIFNINEPGINENGENNKIANLENHIFIYPNPASDFVNISHIEKNDEIVITDIAGNILFRELSNLNSESYPVDIKNISPGVYIIYIVKDGSALSNKLIITK